MKSLPHWVWVAAGAFALVGVTACLQDDSLNPQPLPPDTENAPQPPPGGGATGASSSSGDTPAPEDKGVDAAPDGGADGDTSEGGD